MQKKETWKKKLQKQCIFNKNKKAKDFLFFKMITSSWIALHESNVIINKYTCSWGHIECNTISWCTENEHLQHLPYTVFQKNNVSNKS